MRFCCQSVGQKAYPSRMRYSGVDIVLMVSPITIEATRRINPFVVVEADASGMNAVHSPILGRTNTPKRAIARPTGKTHPVTSPQAPVRTPLTMAVNV